ncbi:hypothetical protein CJD36_019955 [Flavipsychrobacter stenotrophus]|uniref:Uncharacterized protein n=1 Tax=Flavipsychrobacter stenotrophus TaxID=2077091 RepID=A0A2S7SSD8_9BACT|nr:hypothetical protein [Flavipsychrobacter stenotrophus]PQJ09515.1 hypothetical protein CJD36_019955 [Flavipsychrobacter stenotrophus]
MSKANYTGEYLVNKGQIAKIHVLLSQIPGLEDKGEMKRYKENLVRDYTDGRATSTTALSWKEAKDMIAALERLTRTGNTNTVQLGSTPKKEQKLKVNPEEDKKRRKILHFAHLLGWYEGVNTSSVNKKATLTMSSEQPPRRKLDMEQVNGWCVTYGKYKKPLNDHCSEELSVLITQIEKVYKAYLNAV